MVETTYEALLRQTATAEELLAYFQGQRNNLQADIATAQNAYEALSSDLKGVIDSQMNYLATWDPTEANPTNVRGGVFSSLKKLVSSAPESAVVNVTIPEGQTLVLDETVFVGRRVLNLNSNGNNRATIEFASYLLTDANWLYPIDVRGGAIRFSGVNCRAGAKADDAFDWHNQAAVVVSGGNANLPITVSFNGCDISFVDGQPFILPYVGEIVFVSTYSLSLDGPFFLVGGLSTNVALIAKHSLTLSNGAAIVASGTLGTNLLQA